jgi:hypothetical protein
MQGLEALDQFKSFVSKIGGLGRYEDTYMVHAAEGETVIPMEVLDRNPILKKRLFKTMMDMGIEPGRYIVGNELNSKNPVTGQPEFFLKKIVDRLKKAAADVSGYAAPIAGAMYGPAAGALTGGILGSFKRENPGDPRQGLQMGLRGGLTGLATNLASGQGLTPFGGARGAYDMDSLDPIDIGKRMMGMGKEEDLKGLDFFKDGPAKTFFDKTDGVKKSSTKILEEIVKNNPKADTSTINILLEDQLEKASKAKNSVLGGMDIMDAVKLYGLSTAGIGLLFDLTTDEQDVGLPADTMPEGNVLQGTLNPTAVFPGLQTRADGGIMDLQDGGESIGPGTGTSDSIPAMLSDGEFVMTAEAVRGAGGGDRREGAKKMYEAMDKLEARA